MMTEPLSEYVKTRLQLADEMLTDAKLLFSNNRLKSAADRAYYSMFHGAQAALAANGIKAPRTHRGLRSEFSKHLVRTGIIERDYSRDLTLAHEMRQESSYEAYATLHADAVAQLIAKAERFLERINRLVSRGER